MHDVDLEFTKEQQSFIIQSMESADKGVKSLQSSPQTSVHNKLQELQSLSQRPSCQEKQYLGPGLLCSKICLLCF